MNLTKYIQILLNYNFNELSQDEKHYISQVVSSKDDNLNYILLFDIDYCLYDSEECRMAEKKHIQESEAILIEEWASNPLNAGKYPMTYKDLKKTYGSTRIGMCKFFGKTIREAMAIDFNDVEKYIERNDGLIEDLKSLNLPKFCFTNAFPHKAKSILEKLEIESFFKGVFCTIDESKTISQWITKPKDEAYRFVQSYLNPDPNTKIVFFDDSIENIATAQKPEFNWITYHVTKYQDIRKCIEIFKHEYLYEKSEASTEFPFSNPILA